MDREEDLGGGRDGVRAFGLDALLQPGEQLVDDGGLLLDALLAVEVSEEATNLFREEAGEAGRCVGLVERMSLRADALERFDHSRQARRQEGVVQTLAHVAQSMPATSSC